MAHSQFARLRSRVVAAVLPALSVAALSSCGGGSGDGIVSTRTPPLTAVANIPSFAWTVGQNITGAPALLNANGGTPPYTYSATGLPDGVSLDASGAFSGTPTQAASATVSITVIDRQQVRSTPVSVTLTVNARPVLGFAGGVTAPRLNCLVGANPCAIPALNLQGGSAPFTYAVAPALPLGLALNSQSGAITGSPAEAKPSTLYTVTATDRANAITTATFTLATSALSLTPSVLEIGCGEGNGCNPRIDTLRFVASSGTAPYVYTSTTLPSGVTLSSSTGQLSGTITAGLTPTSVTVTAADAQNRSAQATITFSALYTTYTATSTLVCTRGVACAATLLNTNATGKSPYVFSVPNGTLPTGLSLNTATGAISGTATVLGTTSLTMRVTDALGRTSEKPITLTVQEPALVTTVAVAEFACGETNGCTPAAPFTPVTATGGTAPYTFSIAPALPAGMTLNAGTGAISGAPSAALTQTPFTITVQDNASPTRASSSKAVSLSALYTTVAASTNCPLSQPCTLTTVSPNASGKAPYTYAISTGTLPAGLAFNASTGVITGTATSVSTTALTIRVTDALARTSEKAVSLTVSNPALVATQAIATVAYGRESGWRGATSPFTPVTASGGTAPYTFATSGLGLPTGLALNGNSGAISGTPTSGVAPTTYTIRVLDAANPSASATQSFSLSALYVASSGTITCTINRSCSGNWVTPTTAARTPLTYQVASGALPAGMTLNAQTGVISGLPTTSTSQTVRVRVTDALLASDTASVTINVVAPFYATTALAEVACGDLNGCLFAQSACGDRSGSGCPDQGFTDPFTPVTVIGGIAPIVYRITPALPPALTLNTSTGAISGATSSSSAVGSLPQTTFLISATDAVGRIAESTFQLSGARSVVVTDGGSCMVGRPCVFQPVSSEGSGKGPTGWDVEGLPPGLSHGNRTGVLQGIPTLAGTYVTPRILFGDQWNRRSERSFSMTIRPTLLSDINFAATMQVPEYGCGDNGCSPSSPFALVSASGASNYTFQMLNPPGGLTLGSSSGILSGTPPAPVPQKTVHVNVTNSANGDIIRLSFRVSSISAFVTTSNPNTTCQVGVSCGFQPVSPNGTGKPHYTYSSTGTLPPGLSLSATTGILSGTPTTAGSSTATIIITDELGRTARQTVTFTIR